MPMQNLTDPNLTVIDLLCWRASYQADRPAYIFLRNGETEAGRLTYGELDHKAQAIGAQLQALGATGERVLLLYPAGLEYIVAFFGCLYAGAVAVPAYPPRLNRPLDRLQAIVVDAQATVALTTGSIWANLERRFVHVPELAALRWLATDSLSDGLAEAWQPPILNSDSLAFLQYTSGSTAAPKGVMVSHRNILYNERMIQQAFGHTEDLIGVGWLPLYHDMGLIGNILQPAYLGGHCILMSPTDFLQSPFRWLQAISRYQASTSGGPNFAYELCIRKVTPEQRATLDLSSWKVAFNGAEPIRPDIMERFAATFAPCGFQPEAFYPCYGLAEATLFVAGAGRSTPPVTRSFNVTALEKQGRAEPAANSGGSRTLVSCGHSWLDQKIVVADPEALTQCPPEQVGEIWVSGPNIAQGYWNRPAEIRQSFGAYLADTGEGPFLRSGDLGFCQGGELFVTGRIKDLIIIRGRNYFPQDIEQTVEASHAALRAGAGAAFAVEAAGEERLVVVQEVQQLKASANAAEIMAAIRQAVAEAHELQVYGLVLIKPWSLPKTSSGKVQRFACREKYLDGSLEVIASSILDASIPLENAEVLTPDQLLATPAEARSLVVRLYLETKLAQALHLSPFSLDPEQPVSSLGLDSLKAIELAHLIQMDLGITVPVVNFLDQTSLTELTAQILDASNALSPPSELLPVPLEQSANESPLSLGQQALWSLYQLAPESAAYNLAGAVRIRTKLNVAALQRAFQQLVDRHPALRTCFRVEQEEPIQHIDASGELFFQYEDATAWSEATCQARLAVETHHPFKLEQGPLLRVYLLARPAHEHILLLVTHHIITDFWSLAILIYELGLLYQAEKEGGAAALPPLVWHYLDYVQWQAQLLAGSQGEQLWAYWQQELAGELPILNLPTDRPRPPVQTYSGAAQSCTLDTGLTRSLKQLSQNQGVTLYMTLLAAFQVLLYRYTGQEDFLVGSPMAGRSRSEFADLVGYFINPVVLRANLTGDPPFTLLLKRMRQTVLAAIQHQDFPFVTLVERLQPERDFSRSPLFQVMFVFQKSHLLDEEGLSALAMGLDGFQMNINELSLETIALESQAAQFDLTLVTAEVKGKLEVLLKYNTDLFEAATISRLLEHYQVLLAGIVAEPEQRLSQLPLLTPTEQQLLVAWNETQSAYPADRCLHHLFEAQVQRSPDTLAVVYLAPDPAQPARSLTYYQLNQQATLLAQTLHHLGIGPETPVGLCVERSLDMLVGLLAILKAGGAYVPLDPAYPPERVAFMLADSQAPLLLTQHHLLEHLPPTSAQVLCLDQLPSAPGQDLEPLPGQAQPDNLAYIIYTSGSTGQPKGVALSHGNAVALIHWAVEVFGAELLAQTLASTSLCFDLSIFELFAPLSCGGTVVLVQNALHLAHWPASQPLTLVNTVPSVIAEVLRLGPLPASVRAVNLAGEPLPVSLVQQLYQHPSIQQVFDLYGPSETTTYSTWALRHSAGPATIGRPIANTQIYLLDDTLQPVPIGVVGEIYIGGAGVARGYLHRPELTAEKFIPNPFVKDEENNFILHPSSLRLYKTGDLARYLADGQLQFLGRSDHQVKLRGFRIELGEIEAVLRQHPAVEEAVVTVVEQADPRLVAYVTFRPGQTAEPGEVRAFLKKRLPDYMAPSAMVVLAAMPLMPNGKINRRALPLPEQTQLNSARRFVAPRTPVEKDLAEIWTQLLKIGRVGIHDNFFELGGHSILGLRLISQVRNTFQIELPLRVLFELPTIAGLASYIETVYWVEDVRTSLNPAPGKREEGDL